MSDPRPAAGALDHVVVIGSPHVLASPLLSSTATLSDGTPIAEIGGTLSVTQGNWSGSPTSFAYQWYRCDLKLPPQSFFTNCNPIGGATSSSYTTTSNDLGHNLYVEISATNGAGTTTSDVSPVGAVGVPQPLTDDGSVSGTPQVGSTLTLNNGTSWAGDTPITWSYQWYRCDANGNDCAKITNATSDTYTATTDDQGHVIQGWVIGANVWGSNGWGLAYDSAVIAAAPGGGGTGTGGGGGSAANLRVTWAGETTATPLVRAEDDLTLTIANHGTGSAQQAQLTITIPNGMNLIASPSSDHGSGCAGSRTVVCNLDYIPAGSAATVHLGVIAVSQNTYTLTASATANTDSDQSDNTATLTLDVVTSTGPSPVPKPEPVVPAPVLRRVGTRVPSGVTHTSSEAFGGSVSTNEALKLTLFVTHRGSSRRLRLLKGSHLATNTLRTGTTVLKVATKHAGTVAFHAVVARSSVVRGQTYVVHLTATNSRSRTTLLAIPFTA